MSTKGKYQFDWKKYDDEDEDWMRSEFGNIDYDSGYSASSYLNKWGKGWASFDDGHQRMRNALREVARTVNVVRQRFGVGKDKRLKVAWGDNTKGNNQNKDSDLIYLSPDVVEDKVSAKQEWTSDQRNDALMGDALLAAGMKKTMQPATIAQFVSMENGKVKKLTGKLWTAAETDLVRHVVCDDFRGLAPYFKATVEYHTDPNYKASLEEKVQRSLEKPQSRIAAELHAWNILHPDKALAVPAEYADGLKFLNRINLKATAEKDSSLRLALHQKAAAKLAKMYKDDEDEDDGDGDSEGGGANQGAAAGQQPVDDEGKPLPPGKTHKPSNGTNPEQFGDVVGNNVDPNLAKDQVDTKDQSGTDIDTAIRRVVAEHKIWKQADRIATAKLLYPAVRKDAEQLIRQLKGKLKFRSERKSTFEPDYRSGEVDEFALVKLGVDRKDDRIFMKREEIGMPSVAFTILLDESSSMQAMDTDSGMRRCEITRLLACVLVEVLSAYEGVEVAVLGHTSNQACEVKHYYTPEGGSQSHIKQLTALINQSMGTDEGTAIAVAAKNAKKWFGGKVSRNIVLSLSDGGTAIDECKRQVDIAGDLGVEVYGIGIAGAYDEDMGAKLYGPGRFAITKTPMQSIQIIGSFISRVATKGR